MTTTRIDVDGFKKITKPFRGTWLGRAGESTDYLLTSKVTGPRVCVHRWADTGETTVSAVNGDAWRKRKDFRRYALVEIPGDLANTENLRAAIEHCRDRINKALDR
jgi:hypothetical protein